MLNTSALRLMRGGQMSTNEQAKNDQTRTGEDAGLATQGRTAREQASGNVRNNAQVSIRLRARALYLAAHGSEPESVRESSGLAFAVGSPHLLASITEGHSTISSYNRHVCLSRDRESLQQWCSPRGVSVEDAARA